MVTHPIPIPTPRKPRRARRTVALAVVAGLAAAALTTPATAAPARAISWAPCPTDPTAQCGTLSLPVDWSHPDGARFDLALARRTATDPAHRVGTLVFGPGGPGDSGVDRIVTGIGRFDATLRARFDIVSFDPRGVGRSGPVTCSPGLLAEQPSPVIDSPASFAATVAYNRSLYADCRARSGPVFDHLDTMSTVHDLDAVRAALGERALTFHGSSYGTLLGEEYAETYPHRVRALVLESVVDHSLGTSDFLATQSSTAEDSFDEFVAWCGRDASCALHGRDVPALWADLLARAGRGELPDPTGATPLTPFKLAALAQHELYDPSWSDLATLLRALDDGTARPGQPHSGSTYPMAVFCADWNLPVRDYRQYAADLREAGALAPTLRYPQALLALSTCLGWPGRAADPQHRLSVHGVATPLLLGNSLHDPAAGYDWATNVAAQLGRAGVLLTYDGWGHGVYNSSPCAQAAIDRYLLTRRLPPPGTHCPAVAPV
jgi:pimeloyl-ACP methyl ester carboxylesterase